jgi:hypothetical protein
MDDMSNRPEYQFKVEVERTASGKDRVLVRCYGDDLEDTAQQALMARNQILTAMHIRHQNEMKGDV